MKLQDSVGTKIYRCKLNRLLKLGGNSELIGQCIWNRFSVRKTGEKEGAEERKMEIQTAFLKRKLN